MKSEFRSTLSVFTLDTRGKLASQLNSTPRSARRGGDEGRGGWIGPHWSSARQCLGSFAAGVSQRPSADDGSKDPRGDGGKGRRDGPTERRAHARVAPGRSRRRSSSGVYIILRPLISYRSTSIFLSSVSAILYRRVFRSVMSFEVAQSEANWVLSRQRNREVSRGYPTSRRLARQQRSGGMWKMLCVVLWPPSSRPGRHSDPTLPGVPTPGLRPWTRRLRGTVSQSRRRCHGDTSSPPDLRAGLSRQRQHRNDCMRCSKKHPVPMVAASP